MSTGWSSSMAWLWTFLVTQVGGLCSFWRGLLGQTRCLPGRSYSERDLEWNDPLLPVDHPQNGSAFERDYAKKIEELQHLQGECSQLKAQIADLEAQLREKHANSTSSIEELQMQLQSQRGTFEAQLKEEHANFSSKIEELQTQLQSEQSIVAKHEDQLSRFQIYHEDQMAAQREKLLSELQSQRSIVANHEDMLRKLQIYYEGQIAAQKEEIQKLGQQLELAEHQNSHDFAGGESFLDSGPTPHLLNKAVEKVNQTSGNFAKLLMQALKSGGVNCIEVGKEIAPSVTFERAAHTKYVYQALVCKILFADFESECFNIVENASECLDPEQPRKDNFQRYQELISLEKPEELVYEDATDGDFRRFCITKANELIAALSLTGAPGVEDVRALICGQVFGPDGISRGSESQPQIKLAFAFVKCALSVFLVHKLSFSMHPIARIFRLYKSVEFNREYMEPVIALGDSDDEGADPIPLDVGFMVIPGFYVNRIVVHSKVYPVRRA